MLMNSSQSISWSIGRMHKTDSISGISSSKWNASMNAIQCVHPLQTTRRIFSFRFCPFSMIDVPKSLTLNGEQRKAHKKTDKKISIFCHFISRTMAKRETSSSDGWMRIDLFECRADAGERFQWLFVPTKVPQKWPESKFRLSEMFVLALFLCAAVDSGNRMVAPSSRLEMYKQPTQSQQTLPGSARSRSDLLRNVQESIKIQLKDSISHQRSIRP